MDSCLATQILTPAQCAALREEKRVKEEGQERREVTKVQHEVPTIKGQESHAKKACQAQVNEKIQEQVTRYGKAALNPIEAASMRRKTRR